MNAKKNDRARKRTPMGLLGVLGVLGAAAPLAHGQTCDSVTVITEHEFSITFDTLVDCDWSRSIAAVGQAGWAGTPNIDCKGSTCALPCVIGLDSDFDTSGVQSGCSSYASAQVASCIGFAEASTSRQGLYGRVISETSFSQACQTMSLTTFGIADPTLVVLPGELIGVGCTFTITSPRPTELLGNFPGVAVVFGGEVYAVVHRPGGTVTTPAATHNPPDEWVFAIDCSLLPDTLDPLMIAFDRDSLDANGDSGFTQDDVDELVPLIGLAPPAGLEGFDFNGDGFIDAGDVAILQALLDAGLGVCPGDVNGDGAVDLADQNLVLASFGQDVYTAPDLAAALAADLDNSGVVDLPDLNLVLSNFGSTCP